MYVAALRAPEPGEPSTGALTSPIYLASFDALLRVDLTLAAVPSSDHRGSGLHARGFHSPSLFAGHEADLLPAPHLEKGPRRGG